MRKTTLGSEINSAGPGNLISNCGGHLGSGHQQQTATTHEGGHSISHVIVFQEIRRPSIVDVVVDVAVL